MNVFMLMKWHFLTLKKDQLDFRYMKKNVKTKPETLEFQT
jgi:hypothetical protein